MSDKICGFILYMEKDVGPWEEKLLNMWKPTQQHDLSIHGGNFHHSRYYYPLLAIELNCGNVGSNFPFTV